MVLITSIFYNLWRHFESISKALAIFYGFFLYLLCISRRETAGSPIFHEIGAKWSNRCKEKAWLTRRATCLARSSSANEIFLKPMRELLPWRAAFLCLWNINSEERWTTHLPELQLDSSAIQENRGSLTVYPCGGDSHANLRAACRCARHTQTGRDGKEAGLQKAYLSLIFWSA